MVHDAHGWWIAEAGDPDPLPSLSGDTDADVVIVGGGYAGLWTAWHLLEAEPGARVVVLEADRCGHGPSGRNGGFVSSLWLTFNRLVGMFGEARARELCAASSDSVRAIGAWCDAQEVDAWYREAPHLLVSAAPGQDSAAAGVLGGREVVSLSSEAVQAVCASPVLRSGVAAVLGATVQPARLAFGLRERLLARGVRIFEGSPVRTLRGTVAETQGGRVRAGAAVVAINARSGELKPLRNRLTVSSSHIVLTEPVPDVLDAIGWTGGEAITDGRALLHYFRTTRDGRILFGWAGGRMAVGARAGGRMDVDPEAVAQTHRDMLRIFPSLAGRRIEHAWGGPIDVSPTHQPAVVSLPGGRSFAAFGFTGNGVGPAHLAARALASLALDRRDDSSRLAIVDPPRKPIPPEPLRIAGAVVIRKAVLRKEAAEERGERADPVSRLLAGLPAKMGLHIVR